jgi:ABC-type multidrug transport system fused ATPase/permease subunit
MKTNNDDNIIFNYSNELYNNCCKIINDYDTNDDINNLFYALDKYTKNEFEKNNSVFSDNIETIIKNLLTSNFTILDDDTRKYLQNLISFNSVGFSNFISLYNIKEIPNPNSNSLIRFFNYEIKDNFNRFYLHNFLLAINDRISLICVDRQSNIFNGILLWVLIEIKNVLLLEIKKKDIYFLKKYLLQDLKIIYEKTYSKILKDTKNKHKYNMILKKYIENNIKIFVLYNRFFLKIIQTFIDSLYLTYNSLQLNGENPAKTFIPIFQIIIYIYIEYIHSITILHSNKDVFFNTKEQLVVYFNDIIKNFNIISESNTFSKEFDTISIKFNELLETMYKENIEINPWLMKLFSNNESLIYIIKYIMFILIKYNSGLSFELDFIRFQIIRFREIFIDLSFYFSNNIETEKILNSIIEDIERKDLYIKDSEILFTIESLSHRFDRNIIFVNVNLIIPKNKWICFYGNSGSGKTTLCNIILKQLHPDNGLIKYMDKYHYYEYTDICKDISYVTASPEILENTIIYNIVYGINNSEDKEIQDKINYYITKFGLDIFDLHP